MSRKDSLRNLRRAYGLSRYDLEQRWRAYRELIIVLLCLLVMWGAAWLA